MVLSYSHAENLTFKRIVSRDEYFFRILKIKSVIFVLYECWRVSQYLTVFLWRKFKIKFLLTSIQSLTKSGNPFLSGSLSDFQVAKVVPKAACDSENCSKSPLWHVIHHWERRKAGTEILVWLSGTIYRICKCFQRSWQNLLKLFFSFTRQPLNLNLSACTENTDLI